MIKAQFVVIAFKSAGRFDLPNGMGPFGEWHDGRSRFPIIPDANPCPT